MNIFHGELIMIQFDFICSTLFIFWNEQLRIKSWTYVRIEGGNGFID